MNRILIGSDLSGFSLKEAIRRHLEEKGWEIEDLGTQDLDHAHPYYEVAEQVASRISGEKGAKGILICGTGMGMAIVANKFPGVYAAVCENTFAAEKARAINDANILTLGGWITGEVSGCSIVDVFLSTDFTQNLEEWRAKNLICARQKIEELENRLYQK